jgi:hypothetical protein
MNNKQLNIAKKQAKKNKSINFNLISIIYIIE